MIGKILVVSVVLFLSINRMFAQSGACDKCQEIVAKGKGSSYEYLVRKMENRRMEQNETYQLSYCMMTCAIQNCKSICNNSALIRTMEEQRGKLAESIRGLGGTPMDCGCGGLDQASGKRNAGGSGNESSKNYSGPNGAKDGDNKTKVNTDATSWTSVGEKDKLVNADDIILDLGGNNGSVAKRNVGAKNAKSNEYSNDVKKKYNDYLERKAAFQKKMQASKDSLNDWIDEKTTLAQNKEGSSKECHQDFTEMSLAGVGFTQFHSRYSLMKRAQWSEWVLLGSNIYIRFSKKVHCQAPPTLKDFTDLADPGKTPSAQNMAKNMMDFFDYGFFQIQNRGPKASGNISFTVYDEEKKESRGNEHFFLEAGETPDEELGSWYIGCKMLSVKLEEVCIWFDAK